VWPDLFKAPPGEIHKARVTLTVFNGREVYRTPAP